MADLTQKVKYTVEVDLTQLNALQDALKAADTSAKALDTSLANMSKTITAGGLGKALRSMSGTFGAMGTNMAKIPFDATATGLGNLAGAATGAQSALAGAAKGNAAVAQASKTVQTEMSKQATKTKELGEATDRSFRFLKVFGTFQALRFTAQQVFQSIKEGAQQLDLDNILSRQFSNFREEIAKAQDLTAGTVGRGALTKSYALMSSFGIPMDQFAENMELVQKMAVRTGQSADFLTESFARGISRLSPLILDNLGIQVSLGEANQEYAVATGKLTTELTKEERIAALLQHTLRKLRENTEGVSLSTGSAAAAVNRVETAFSDLWTTLKSGVGEVFLGVDQLLQSQADDMAQIVAQLRDVKGDDALSALADRLEQIAKVAPDAGNELEALVNPLARMSPLVAMFSDAADAIEDTRTNTVGAHLELQRYIVAYEAWLAKKPGTVREALDFRGGRELDAAKAAEAAQDLLAAGTQEASRAIVAGIIAQYEGLLSEQQESVLLEKAAAAAAERHSAALAAAKFMQDKLGMSKEESIIHARTLIGEYESLNAELEMLVEGWVDTIAANTEAEKVAAARLATLAEDAEFREHIHEMVSGTLATELQLNQANDKRSAILQEIGDLREKLAENEMDNEVRLALEQKYNDLAEADRAREIARLAVQLDNERLESYRGATRAKIEEDAKILEGFITMFRAIAESVKTLNKEVYKTFIEQAAAMEAFVTKMRAMARSGGGGGAADAMDFTKDVVDSKSYEDEWTIVKRFWKEAQNMKKGFPELFPSIGDTLFGGFTPEQWTRQETVLEDMERQFDVLAARFGEEYTNLKLSKMFDVEDFRSTLATVRDEVDRLGKHMRNLRDVSSILHDVADGFKAFGGALREDMFGAGVIDQIKQFATNMDKFTEALKSNKSAYDLTLASIPIMRQFTNAFIKDRRAQAGIEAAMQAAAAFAAWAIPNPAKALAHTAAAMLYAGVAGGAIKLPSGKPRDTTPKEGRGSSGGEVRRPDIHIYLQGTLVQTEAERGVLAQHAIAEARRRGML